MLTFNDGNFNETLCGILMQVDDEIVEINEVFTFLAAAQNSLDYFVGGNSFQLTIYDDDGMLKQKMRYIVTSLVIR